MKRYALIVYATKNKRKYAHYTEINSREDRYNYYNKIIHLKMSFKSVEFATHSINQKAIDLGFYGKDITFISDLDKFIGVIKKDKEELK